MFIMKFLFLLILIMGILGCVVVVLRVDGKLKFIVLSLFEVSYFFGCLYLYYCVVYIWCCFILVEMIVLFFVNLYKVWMVSCGIIMELLNLGNFIGYFSFMLLSFVC